MMTDRAAEDADLLAKYQAGTLTREERVTYLRRLEAGLDLFISPYAPEMLGDVLGLEWDDLRAWACETLYQAAARSGEPLGITITTTDKTKEN